MHCEGVGKFSNLIRNRAGGEIEGKTKNYNTEHANSMVVDILTP